MNFDTRHFADLAAGLRDTHLDDLLRNFDWNFVIRKLNDKANFSSPQTDQKGFAIRDASEFGKHIDRETQIKNAKEQFDYLLHHFFGTGDPEHFSFYELFYIFVFSAGLGSLVEELWCRVSNGYWENRTSVVYGKFSFAEAIAGVFLTILLYRDMDAPVEEIFAKSFVWCSVLEYIMSWGEETFTGYRSWDYSHRLFNINGRICFMYSCFWGMLGILWCKFIYPVLKYLMTKVPKSVGIPAFWGTLAFLLYDIIVSAFAKSRFTARQDGIPAINRLQKYFDRKFPDEVVIKAYPNSRRSRDGDLAGDTLNHTDERALENSPIKRKLKEFDRAREDGEDLRDIAAGMAADAKDFAGDMGQTVREKASDVTQTVRERSAEAMEKVEPALSEGREAINPNKTHSERKASFKRAVRILISILFSGSERH